MGDLYTVDSEDLTNIANAIRTKKSVTTKYKIKDMPAAITSISSGTKNTFRYSGTNAQLVDSFYKEWDLSDTSFEIGVTAPTASTAIKAAEANLYTSPTIAFGDKDIIIVQYCEVEPIHTGGSGKAQFHKFAYVYITLYSKRKTSNTSANTTRQTMSLTQNHISYYNSSGNLARTTGTYGFYMTPSAASVASTTAANTTVRASSPILNVRTSTSYETADNMKKVTSCKYKWKVEVYTTDKLTNIVSEVNKDIDNIILNGVS